MYNLGYEIDWNSVYYMYTILMIFLNCTVNPFIYLIKYQDYQQALQNFICCEKVKSSKGFHDIVSVERTTETKIVTLQ